MRAALLIRTLACAAPLIAIAPTIAHAESSSWFWRSDEEKKAAPAKSPAKSDVSKAKPKSDAKGPEIKSSVPATGDDAAYLAFDQGQYLTALKLAEEAAKRGEPQAHTLIARIYAEGLGVPKDEKAAVASYQRAADLGDVSGAFALGLMLAQGRGVEKNLASAAEMFEKAALTGHAEANYNLGLLFLRGAGKPENPKRAFQHIQFAAEKGIAQAQYDLAAMYQTGTGVEPDAREIARWMSRAAEQGLAVAQFDYAVLLLKGLGLTKDEPKAAGLLRAAADKGLAAAQNRLAHLHFEGAAGVAKDTVEAAKWRLIAKQNGFDDKTLDATIDKLSKTDRQKAEVAASAWIDRIQVLPQ